MLGATGIAIRLLVAVLEVVNRTEQPMPGSIDGTHQHGGKNSENTSHLSLSLPFAPQGQLTYRLPVRCSAHIALVQAAHTACGGRLARRHESDMQGFIGSLAH